MTTTDHEEQSLAAWKSWNANTEQLPLSEFQRIADEPTTILPARGSYYFVANNLDELTTFFCKVDDLSCWSFALKEVYTRDEDDELGKNEAFVDTYSDAWEEREMRTLSYNEFYDYEKRLHVTKEVVTVTKPAGIVYREDFLDNLTFPCLVQNSADGGHDRIGNFEINHCQILDLPGIPMRSGPVVYCVSWL